jgi:CRISPR-associated protein Cas2
MHKERLKMGVPNNGSIRVLTVTEKQYNSVDILLGKKLKYEKPIEYETLSFF